MLLVNNNGKEVTNQDVMAESINIKTFSTAAKNRKLPTNKNISIEF